MRYPRYQPEWNHTALQLFQALRPTRPTLGSIA